MYKGENLQMTKIQIFGKNLKELLNEKADTLSLLTKFIKRRRKVKGSSFAKAMIIGNLGQESSLEGICTLFCQEDIEITKQALDLRFTKESVEFMENLYTEALGMMEESLSINCKVLKLFHFVKLLDSSYINLPENMRDQYRGYGSSYKNRPCSTQAGLKIQVVYDYLNQIISRLDIKEGIRSDQGYKDYLKDVHPGDLLIADLGYFAPNSFKIIHEQNAYFLSRYKADTNLYDPDTKEKIDLLALLKDQVFMTRELLLGSQTKLKVRIVCQKLTQEQSTYRRRKANKLAKSRGYKSSYQNQNLLDWAVFITNIPFSYVATEDLSKLYRLRWQVELLFKLYKSYGGIDRFYSKKPCRVLCQIYAKLIAMAIFHSLANCLYLQQGKEFSPMKAFDYLKLRGVEIFLTLRAGSRNLGILLKNIMDSWSRFCLKDRYRKKRLSTLNSLATIPPGA